MRGRVLGVLAMCAALAGGMLGPACLTRAQATEQGPQPVASEDANQADGDVQGEEALQPQEESGTDSGDGLEGPVAPEDDPSTSPAPDQDLSAGSGEEEQQGEDSAREGEGLQEVSSQEGSGTSGDSSEDTASAEADSSDIELFSLDARSVDTAEVYRLYNPYTGEHHYTMDSYERDVDASAGWRFEGVGWVAPVTSDKPVYRVYNPYTGDHHYTMDSYERNQLVAVGWRDEGIGWYSAGTDGVPLYRHYNPYASVGTHHYTPNMSERLHMTGEGWRYEGIAWYGIDEGPTAPEGNASGWVESQGYRFWGNGDGTYATGLKSVDGKTRYFDARGRMATGPVDVGGTVYCFGSDGGMLTGWQDIEGHRYFFDTSSGAMRKDGWFQTGGFRYYLDKSSGAMATGWLQDGGSEYYLDPSSGIMATGWASVGGQLYDFGSDGRWVTQHYHNIEWAGQPNNYFCGPTSGFMILRNVGRWTSANGSGLSIDNVATAMRTREYGYTSFQDRWFSRGMNQWLGADVYTSVHTPSYETVRNAIMRSYQNGYATAVDTQERRGGPHYNGHNNGTFAHIMVVDGYDQASDAVQIVDPGAGVLWPQGSQKFWYNLRDFVQTYMQHEVFGDRERIGVHYAV